MDLTERLILIVTGLLLWGGHHVPWRIVPGLTDEKGELERVAAYIYGVACILGGLAWWCAYLGDWTWFWRVGLLALAAGLGTVLPRLLKREVKRQNLEGDNADYEQTLKG